MSQQEPNKKWMPLIIGLVLVLLMFGLSVSIAGGGGGASGPVVPVPATFTIISLVNGTSYNAYLSTSTIVPFFSESSFQKIMQTDVLSSSACFLGCSIALLPGKFNQTETINVTRPGIAISGTFASVIYPQKTVFHSPFHSAFNLLSTATGFAAQGFKMDDYNRVNSTGITGDLFTVGSSGWLFNQLTIWNASSNGISVPSGSNGIVSFSTIISTIKLCTTFGPLQNCNGNYGILIGTAATSIRIDFNTISMFNFTDTSAINMANGASNIEVGSNEIFQNSFGISSQWGKALNIHDNKIHDNFGAGILLTTGAFGSASAGPITITANVITNNGKEPNTDVQCNNLRCSGIVLRGVRPIWDGVTIVGNTIKDTQASPTQYFDIHLASVNYSNLTITGNTLGRTRNGTLVFLAVNPLKTWIITANPGFNAQPVRGPITACATPCTYVNNDAYMEQIELITIGDMTAFTCRGIANIIQVDAISPVLNTLETCIFTYVLTAPTYDVLPMQG